MSLSAAWELASAVFKFSFNLVSMSLYKVGQTTWAVMYSLTWPVRTFVILPIIMFYSFVMDELSPLLLFVSSNYHICLDTPTNTTRQLMVAGVIGVTGGAFGVLLTSGIELLYDSPAETRLVKTPSRSEASRSSESSEDASRFVLQPPVKAPWRSSHQGSSLLSQTIHEEDSI